MSDTDNNHHETEYVNHFSSDDFSDHQNKKLCFDPPLYIQRYNYVSGILFDFKCKSFMDIGCAECKLIHLLKQTNQYLNLIVGLDLDDSVLEKNKSKFSDNLVDLFHCRENPLDLYLIKGDISKPDEYFLNQFCAENCDLDFVSMVEIIEHMYPETLQAAIEIVFGHLKPKFVLITTPNREFNVVFQDDANDDKGSSQKFRHWDHKFEWTRDEFQKWCKEKILKIYQNYKLFNNSFNGLGEPPKEFESVGHCTQMALFYNQDLVEYPDKSISNPFKLYLNEKKKIHLKNRYRELGEEPIEQKQYFNTEDAENYNSLKKNDADMFKLVFSLSYPFEIHEFDSAEERNRVLLDEINYLIFFLISSSKYQRYQDPENYDAKDLASHLTEEEKEKIDNDIDIHDDSIKIAKVDTLLNFSSIKKFNVPYDEIIDIMKKAGYKFTKQDKFVIHLVRDESDSESYEDDEDAYDDFKCIESPRGEVDFVISKIDEQHIDDSFMEEKNCTKLNDFNDFEEENWDQYLPQVSEMQELNYKESLCLQFEDADDTDSSHYTEEYIQQCLNFELKTRQNRLRLTDFPSCNYNGEKQKKIAHCMRAIRKRNRKIVESPSVGQFSLD